MTPRYLEPLDQRFLAGVCGFAISFYGGMFLLISLASIGHTIPLPSVPVFSRASFIYGLFFVALCIIFGFAISMTIGHRCYKKALNLPISFDAANALNETTCVCSQRKDILSDVLGQDTEIRRHHVHEFHKRVVAFETMSQHHSEKAERDQLITKLLMRDK